MSVRRAAGVTPPRRGGRSGAAVPVGSCRDSDCAALTAVLAVRVVSVIPRARLVVAWLAGGFVLAIAQRQRQRPGRDLGHQHHQGRGVALAALRLSRSKILWNNSPARRWRRDTEAPVVYAGSSNTAEGFCPCQRRDFWRWFGQ
jgi:hypothetical protein